MGEGIRCVTMLGKRRKGVRGFRGGLSRAREGAEVLVSGGFFFFFCFLREKWRKDGKDGEGKKGYLRLIHHRHGRDD